MQTEISCLPLTAALGRILNSGLEPGPRVLEVVDSLLLAPSLNEIQAVLDDPNHSDHDTLLDLFLFPDEALQARVETYLTARVFGPADIAAVAAELCRSHPAAKIRLPGKHPDLRAPLSFEAARRFVSRLNIDRQLNAQVLVAIEKHLPDGLGDLTRVKFRNAAPLEARQAGFCALAVEKLGQESDFLDCLDLILTLLDETSGTFAESDFYAYFQAKKFQYAERLRYWREVEEKRLANAMEVMLLQGIRQPGLNPILLETRMAGIDRICLAIYGRIAYGFGPQG